MIDMTVDRAQRERSARWCGERGILIPTFAQMKNPALVPGSVRDELQEIGLWDLHPRNLYRITWKNEPVPRGGGFGGVNAIVTHRNADSAKRLLAEHASSRASLRG